MTEPNLGSGSRIVLKNGAVGEILSNPLDGAGVFAGRSERRIIGRKARVQS